MNTYAEFFGNIFFQSIVLGMLVLFAFAVAFRGPFRGDASVITVWIATAIAVFGLDRSMVSFNELLRDILMAWAGLNFFILAVCSAVWIRNREDTAADYRGTEDEGTMEWLSAGVDGR
jgi:hypothetical protein